MLALGHKFTQLSSISTGRNVQMNIEEKLDGFDAFGQGSACLSGESSIWNRIGALSVST